MTVTEAAERLAVDSRTVRAVNERDGSLPSAPARSGASPGLGEARFSSTIRAAGEPEIGERFVEHRHHRCGRRRTRHEHPDWPELAGRLQDQRAPADAGGERAAESNGRALKLGSGLVGDAAPSRLGPVGIEVEGAPRRPLPPCSAGAGA